MITAAQVKELREKTGVGIMDCKNALVETKGDMEKATTLLREKGLAKAAKKSSRIASEGLVESYIHNGKYGAMVEINSETDFVAKNEEFKTFAKDIAMHIAAIAPKYVSKEEIPSEIIKAEKDVLASQALNEGKPEAIIEKMIEGRMNKFYEETCLLEQAFVKNPDITVQELLNEKIAIIGENIVIRRFVRFERGEGLEKKETNLAEEVLKQIHG